jgi:ribosomal protein S18 acetylase RimI-like enzyme
MSTFLRIAQESDIPDLVELMSEFYAESQYSLDRFWASRSFTQLLKNPARGGAWVAHDGRDAMGYVVLTTRHSMEYGGLDGFIDDFFVRPRYRRHGLGTSLLGALIEHCRRHDVLAVHVEVGLDNAAAQAVYRRFGLAESGRQLLTARILKEKHAGSDP